AQAIRIMQRMRSGPKQLRALAEKLDARQEAKCQKRETDLVHDPSAQSDERQKSDRSGETSLYLSRPPFHPPTISYQFVSVSPLGVRHFSRATYLSNAFQNVR